MNFYIGNSIKDINIKNKNIEFSDELINYIYGLRNHDTIDMSILYQIDPYADEKISKNDILSLINICEYLLGSTLLEFYADKEEAKIMLKELMEISKEAINMGVGLVSIGD